MRQEDAVVYTERCFNGDPAVCMRACPFSLDIRSLLEKTEKGRWNAAYKMYRNAVVFPVITSALCPAPCKGSCQRSQLGDEPIDLNLIEDAIIRYAKNKKPDNYVIPPKKERIAVIGAGLSGLTGALCLAQKKYAVTVYEKSGKWGGRLRRHERIEEFDEEIALQLSAVTVEFRYEREIKTLDELSDYDLIYVATGRGGSDYGLLGSWEPKLLTTEESRVFLGGSLTGANPQESVVQGKQLSKTAEVFLQTGKAAETYGNDESCAHEIDQTGKESKPRVVPAQGGFYSESEAKEESARCMQCDCDMCMRSCEMLMRFRKKPKKIAMEVYTDTQVNPPFSSHTITRQAYSCNMCGHCKTVCSVDSDIGAVLQKSRAARIEHGVYPEALHDFWLREMDFATGAASFYGVSGGGGTCEYLFYPGCQLGEHNPDHVLRAFDFLSRTRNVGIYTGCCGAPAYWAGDNERMDSNFKVIESVWRELGNPVFIFACATCESLFHKFLPDIKRISLYELMKESELKTGGAAIYAEGSVFDPCNARSNHGMEGAVRDLAERSGITLTELSEKNRCCGYGGHMKLGNPELYEQITGNRAAMGSLPYVVYCANCREVFRTRGKECAHILDIAFGLPHDKAVPRIEQKHENAIKVKKELSRMILETEYEPEERPWEKLRLRITEELAAEIDGKLISGTDLKEAIWRAEETGEKFRDVKEGVTRCSMEKRVMTYWVAYREINGEYEVTEAYSHRMRFTREEASK